MTPNQNSDVHPLIRKRHFIVVAVLGLALAMAAPMAGAQMVLGCGSLENAYGPYDYTNPRHFRERLEIVEISHFDAGVESLRGHARKPVQLTADLDYTLRAFPNHHKALYSMLRYNLSKDPRHRKKMRYTADCYFNRALTWQPRDGQVRVLYGLYLSRTGKIEEAKVQFQEAANLMPESPEVHYNIGLMLAKSGDYIEARKHAHKAYALGHPMQGLKNILTRAGEWEEPAAH
ncbi:MAG: tetratricopeptide repeat protein [Gammaproteobacteria bacterium]